MRISSSGSVKVIYLDRQRVIAGVKRAVARLTQAHREIKKVVLFGSLARGDVVPGSDADLLIVLSESAHPFLERISLYTPAKVPLSVDVFPYTEKELARMVADGNHFIKTALSEGLTLFVRKETRK
ncbi:MAG: nucleotidyltransferase domain-containing protein [Chloroflexi bacterium]|nr:nucleotidyltransferase domain-containing protein [Chloroflexota bacterium]